MSTIDTPISATAVSRRSALRGAAWTASAVSLVVATPNVAAATGGAAVAGVVTYAKSGNILTFSTALNTNTNTLTAVQAVVTVSFTGGKNPPRVLSARAGAPWTVSDPGTSLTFSATNLSGSVVFAPALTVTMPSFDSVVVSITYTYTWAGVTKVVATGGTFAQ